MIPEMDEPRSMRMKPEQLKKELEMRKEVRKILGKEKLFLEKGCVHWSRMSGKMYGKRSIGRPMTDRCESRHNIDGAICQKCYAVRINQVYPSVGNALQRNRDLTIEDLHDDPTIFTSIDPTWRSNWNGDYQDEHDVRIDMELCWMIDYATCTTWTKNCDIVERMDSYRPKNYTVVQSSLMINQFEEEVSSSTDQVFTVFTPEYAAENDININCIGACRLCGRCYGDNMRKRPRYINELLRGTEKKYFELLGVL